MIIFNELNKKEKAVKLICMLASMLLYVSEHVIVKII